MKQISAWLSDGRVIERAGLGSRLAARLIDTVLLAPAFAAFLLPFYGLGAGSFARDVLSSLGGAVDDGPVVPVGYWLVMGLALVVLVLYEPVMIGVWGATVGKLIMRIRVARFADGSGHRMHARGWARSLGPSVAGLTSFGVGWFAAWLVLAYSMDRARDGRGWHDKLAGTIVVRSDARPAAPQDSPQP